MKYFRVNQRYIFMILMFITAIACNKTKQHSDWLTGETWQVITVTVDGQPFNLLPKFTFDDCDIYNEICFGSLRIENQGPARFAWQVREKGNIFELSDQTEIKDASNEEAVSFSSSFSGVYHVTEANKSEMIIECDNCKRYSGKKVIIKLSKE